MQTKIILPVFSNLAFLLMILAVLAVSCNKNSETPKGKLEISSCFVGNTQLQPAVEATNIPLDKDIKITFNAAVDTTFAKLSIFVNDENNISLGIRFIFTEENKTILLKHSQNFATSKKYFITITEDLKGSQGQTFEGTQYIFRTSGGDFELNSILIEGIDFSNTTPYYNINRQGLMLSMEFSEPVDTNQASSHFTLSDTPVFEVSYDDDYRKVNLICPLDLEGYKYYAFEISTSLNSAYGSSFQGFSNSFITEIDSTLKFPLVSDEELLTLIQRQTFRFFYDYAHPASGMSRERYGSGDIVTSGGSGFGVMALIVGIERGFITRDQGISQLTKMIGFLESCDRFHGAWSHWINGSNGNVVPFSSKDNGGDLVETAYMAQGLLTMRQYLNPENTVENALIGRISDLYNGIEWNWYTRGGQNVLFWHWSPNYEWDMNMQIRGYNETLITYIMAASSTTYSIPAAAYHTGYALNGGIINGDAFYGYTLPVGYDYGGPLFFAHYSFLGLDPRNLTDTYAGYWTQNVNHSLINWAYCADNPKAYPNYNEHCWGLTASDIPSGYAASEPTNDRGVIAPTAAVSSIPYTPEQSMNAIRHFYYLLGDHLWGEYGFYDAFDVHAGWWADSFISIDQGPQIVMIENYRTGLLWDLFMSAPEVQTGLEKLGFSWQK